MCRAAHIQGPKAGPHATQTVKVSRGAQHVIGERLGGQVALRVLQQRAGDGRVLSFVKDAPVEPKTALSQSVLGNKQGGFGIRGLGSVEWSRSSFFFFNKGGEQNLGRPVERPL